MIKKTINSIRNHKRQIMNEIIREPLNYGRRTQFFFDYIAWHLFYKYLGRKWEVNFENGIKSYVYPYPDHDAGEVNIWTRNVDWYDIELIRKVIKKDDFVVDAGCNVGNRTLALADMLSGALLMDAGKRASERTIENFQLNDYPCDKFIVLNKAVGSSCGLVEFTNFGGASTLNHVVSSENRDETDNAPTTKVELTTIDAELERINRQASFIKVDVEGFDLEVLRGSINTLKGGTVRLVKFERNSSDPLEPILVFFSDLDWQVFALDQNGKTTTESVVLNKNMNLFSTPTELYNEISNLSRGYKK